MKETNKHEIEIIRHDISTLSQKSCETCTNDYEKRNNMWFDTVGLKHSAYLWTFILFIALIVNRYHSSNKELRTDTVTNATYSSCSNKSWTNRDNDEEYWRSVCRQKYLEDMGLNDAAKMERNERLKYIRGGGYHSIDGTPQIHFNGSQEQIDQIRRMEDMGW